MTKLRMTVLALAVALFAAALGVALGAGPLQDDMQDAFLRRQSDSAPDPEAQQRLAALQRTVQYDQDAVASLAPALLAGRLQDRPVAVLALPGADRAQVDAVVADIEAADGAVTTRMRVAEDLVDPAARTLVDTLSAGQLQEYGDLEVPPGASVYERVGLVLGRALLTDPDAGEPIDDGASSVLNGFVTADLLTGDLPDRRASLLVLVAGGEPVAGGPGTTDTGEADQADEARGSIISTLARTVGSQGDGIVVAGPPASAEADGAVAAVREDPDAVEEVSTIDTVDARLGQVGTVLALAEQAAGSVGHYGVVDAPDGAVPR